MDHSEVVFFRMIRLLRKDSNLGYLVQSQASCR